MTKKQEKCEIIFGDDYIQIIEADTKKEIIYWDKQEWIDEPEVVFCIVNGIKIALEEGAKKLKDYLQIT